MTIHAPKHLTPEELTSLIELALTTSASGIPPADLAKLIALGYVVMMPSELYKSLTWDRGKELSDHRRFTLATNIEVYFCDPQSPWQRGSNENKVRKVGKRSRFPRGLSRLSSTG
jgi:IS30 family transposase